ncbi:MAG TPA: cupin domain-containing protein [Acidimicrobiia bacterium]|nr:cupin domain-containing protein [Acidimicrobiia bacterium]
MPIDSEEPSEPTARPLQVPPDAGGSIVHVIDMPPGSGAPMHRTKSIDYGIVLSGEIDLELDDGSEVHLRSGDIVVQRATAHAWHNRSQSVTRMLFVMIDVELSDELASTLGEAALAEILR